MYIRYRTAHLVTWTGTYLAHQAQNILVNGIVFLCPLDSSLELHSQDFWMLPQPPDNFKYKITEVIRMIKGKRLFFYHWGHIEYNLPFKYNLQNPSYNTCRVIPPPDYWKLELTSYWPCPLPAEYNGSWTAVQPRCQSPN